MHRCLVRLRAGETRMNPELVPTMSGSISYTADSNLFRNKIATTQKEQLLAH